MDKFGRWTAWWMFGLSIAGATILWLAVYEVSRRQAISQLVADAEVLARQHSRLIDSELARFRLLPIVLAEYGDFANTLTNPTPMRAFRLSEKLGYLARDTGASILYLTDITGTVVAASNADRSDSFVGQNFNFRPYFQQAIKDGSSEYYGAGALTKRPGLFMAHRVGEASRSIGVVVVKYEFDGLSEIWSTDPGQTFVTDTNSVILAAPDPSALLKTLWPLSSTLLASMKNSNRYGEAQLNSVLDQGGVAMGMLIEKGERLVSATLPVAGTDLKLIHIMDTAPTLEQARLRAQLIMLPIVLIVILVALCVWWWITRATRAASQRRLLEAAVLERTTQLREEMGQRILADERFREAREELAQANRLASVGSITAGLMHEVNQPVATIRTLSENAKHHLGALRFDKVKDNLEIMIAMTERIATITQEMRGYSRKQKGVIAPEPLDGVIAGAMLLVESRLRKAEIRLDLPPSGQPRVLAQRVRLEQVIVNIIQNAIDAVADQSDPHISLCVTVDDGFAMLRVADNGPGIDPSMGKDVFLPFVSGKPDGLGLGLGIAQDIMRDLGGTLAICQSPLGGAAFMITVRLA